jgi:hypothetical protein
MFLPRRRQRRLLLPPGWVALGFLLLLGCLALLTHRQQLQFKIILQLTMPLSKKKVEEQHRAGTPYYQLFSNPIDSLSPATRWYDANLNGEALNDFVNVAAVRTVVSAIKADTSRARGARIYFRQGATYSSLVSLLDLMNRLKYRYYWFDIEHRPAIFYIVNNQAAQRKESAEIANGRCCMCLEEEYREPLTEATFQQVIANLCQQVWRPSILLLIAISVLSFYRLSRLHRAMC